MEIHIGKKLKNIRNYLHMTQQDLAKGICTQSMISLIEKDTEIYPSAHLLYLLSKRLGVSIEYFFSDEELYNKSYVQEVCDQLTELIQEKKYEKAYEMIQFEKKNPDFKNRQDLKQLLLWREAICINYLFNNKTEALELLDEAMKLSDTSDKNYSLIDLDILTSKAIILSELELLQESYQLYNRLIEYTKKLPAQPNKSTTVINIYYNGARVANLLEYPHQALSLCEEGIQSCLRANSSYLLGYLFYLKAEILSTIGPNKTDEIKKYYQKAINLFDCIDDFSNKDTSINQLKKFQAKFQPS
ncbi:helix-turn-helix domain-containing protein [Alkalihalobacillus pseudalcaliphilus]|uniref:helix-turn-helix domain-containing protein n=1 Tax=Alkalihalobacillus pseudalcaliphilus TaxID=79884 RepID=UPI00064DE416|nr:helix-turn-helix domain-containing protein [Alkalihalobacillus pseudalcaliphilus]KMK78082.1 hypothetical protein AB990_01125 [Alkalihalobacillus pseudalcaliphilus]